MMDKKTEVTHIRIPEKIRKNISFFARKEYRGINNEHLVLLAKGIHQQRIDDGIIPDNSDFRIEDYL